MEQLSGEHLAAVTVTASAAASLVLAARRRGRSRAEVAGRVLAVLIMGAYLTEHGTYIARGTWTASANLPLHLSDAVTLVAVAALWRPRSGLLVELLYFWAFSASLQAVLTPGVGRAFPDVLYFTYFATHGGVIVAASLLVFGCARFPRRGAVLRVYGVTAALAVTAGVASVITGGNYMFLRAKPPRASLLDLMGPWPWYLVGGAVLGLLMFVVLAALAERSRNASGTR
jgi:hypothetical integral membrane protein (TIGR02206 family)